MFDFLFPVPVRLGGKHRFCWGVSSKQKHRTYRAWECEIGRKNGKLNRPDYGYCHCSIKIKNMV